MVFFVIVKDENLRQIIFVRKIPCLNRCNSLKVGTLITVLSSIINPTICTILCISQLPIA